MRIETATPPQTGYDDAPQEGRMPGEDVHGDPLTILLVEDNLPHAELVKRSLETGYPLKVGQLSVGPVR